MRRRGATLGVVALAMVLGGEAAAQQPRAAEPPSWPAAERYFFEEDVYNGIYVGLGATGIGVGGALITRDDDGLRGAGFPVAVVGGIQLVIGAVYLALTPGLRADARRRLMGGSEGLGQEARRMAALEGNFVYYELSEATTALTGLALGIAGAARDDATMTGVGTGLALAAVVQLTMENITHEAASRYLRRLAPPPAP